MPGERIWDRYINDRDLTVLRGGGFGGQMGFPKRPALVVIDVSIGFCGEQPEPVEMANRKYPTSCGQAAWDALPHIEKLIAAARGNHVPVIYTTGQYRTDGWDHGAWRWKQVRDVEASNAAVPVTDPQLIMPQIAPKPDDIVVLKQKPSAFFGTNLISYLNLLGCDGLILAGCTTSGCVRATAVDAAGHNYRVTVAEEACFDRFDVSHAVALFDMHVKYADVIATASVVEQIAALPADTYAGTSRFDLRQA